MKDDIKSICACVLFYLITLGIAYGASMGPNSRNEVTIVVCGCFGCFAPWMGRWYVDDSPHPEVMSSIILAMHLILLAYLFFVKHMYWEYGNTMTGWSIGCVLGYLIAGSKHQQKYK